jgi:hypothetical protein
MPGPRRAARDRKFRRLDCSGFMRMIWGYRRKHGWSWPCKHSAALPTFQRSDGASAPILSDLHVGPGVVAIQDTHSRVDDLSRLAIGDLLFFDRETQDGPRLDHVGMHSGPDEGGHHRFVSSRKTHNGPTLGDEGGRSIRRYQRLCEVLSRSSEALSCPTANRKRVRVRRA